MKIAVVALGKIGLPLAVQFADADPSHEVVGVDVDQRVVDLVNAGTEPFPGEDHLADKLAELVPAGRLRATTDYGQAIPCLLYTSPSPRDKRQSRMPSSA